MKVRVYQAFASNNSGSYVLVGTFREAAVATTVKDELERIFAEHTAWLEGDVDRRWSAGPTPLHAWATEAGLATTPNDGATDDWPDNRPPEVVASGDQVLVFVQHTVTFPRLVGELLYKRGGRVSVELDHAHEVIVLSHEIWMHEGWNHRDEASRRVDAFRAAVEGGALASLHHHARSDVTRTPPILRKGFWPGQVVLVHTPFDVAEGLRAVDALATEHRLRSRFSLFESPVHDRDPVRAYRALDPAAGGFDVILWKVGADLAATQRAVRLCTGLDASGTAELVAKAPIEILRDVAVADAERAVSLVAGTGADVELVRPETKGPPR